jgi:hypothetical protein
MSRIFIVGSVTAVYLCSIGALSVHAQHGHAATHTVTTAAHGQSPKPSPSSHVTAQPATHGSATTHGHVKNTSSTAHPTSSKPRTSAAPRSGTPGRSKTTRTTTTSSTRTLTPVQQKLARNTNLASKLQSRLPAGTDLQKAAAGFRNLGQFVAAVNVSHNLDIPFDQLKADMVKKGMSLGQSIQDLRPTADATRESEHAQADADDLLIQTSSTDRRTSGQATSTKTAPVHKRKTKTTGSR